MKLLYDKSDLAHAKKLRDDRYTWLQSLGAADLSVTPSDEEGFFFGYQHGDEPCLARHRATSRNGPVSKRLVMAPMPSPAMPNAESAIAVSNPLTPMTDPAMRRGTRASPTDMGRTDRRIA